MSLPNIPLAMSIEFMDSVGNTKQLTILQKIKYTISNISVEPLALAYAVGTITSSLAAQNLHLEKACRVNLQYNSSVCDAMVQRNRTGYEFYQEKEVQKLVTKAASFKSICIGTFPAVIMLFLGSWSDRNGRRKPVIMLPLFGEVLTAISLFMCSYFFLELPLEASAFSESVPFAMTGAWFCSFVGLYSYVSGISSEGDKTVRIGSVSMCLHLGLTFGILMSGFLIKPLGYKGVFSLSLLLIAFAIIYGFIMIKEKSIAPTDIETNKNRIMDFFDIKHVKATFRMCFKEGPENRKQKMIVIMIISMMIMGPFYAEFTIIYLYTRLKFGWNEVDFSVYNTTHFLIQIPGAVFALTFFSKYLKVTDSMLGMIAISSKLFASIIYAFAPTWTFFYLGAVVEIFNGTTHIALRSIMAKIVPAHELGQSNSVFGICEATMPLIFGPLYTSLYYYSMNYFPGTFFLVSSILYFNTLVLFYWLHRQTKHDLKIREDIQKNIEQEENLLKKACFNEMRKSMEKLKSTQSLHRK